MKTKLLSYTIQYSAQWGDDPEKKTSCLDGFCSNLWVKLALKFAKIVGYSDPNL